MTIGIIDYGMGNLLSVKNAVEYLGFDAELINDSEELETYDKLILPGVGSFPDCMNNLQSKNFIAKLNQLVLINKKPILGICLGMQVIACKGFENTETNGLGWIDGVVELIKPDNINCRIPHVGWSETNCTNSFLFNNIKGNPEFYYVHSYYMNCKNNENVIATFNHGGVFTSAVSKENIIGCQFHPEKSQEHGLTLLNNFIHHNFNG